MSDQVASSHVLSLRLEAGSLKSNNKFQLYRKRREHLGIIVVTIPSTEHPVTLFCDSLTETCFDLIESLRSGLLELVDSGNEDKVIVPRPFTPLQPCPLKVPRRPFPQYLQTSVGISADTTHAVWKEVLQPGHTYGLRLSKNNSDVSAFYSDYVHGQPDDFPPNQELSIRREGATCYFAVHDDPAPPKVFARLEMPRYAHLTGPIPFTFTIEYTTDSPRPFVVDKSHSPLSVFDEDLKSIDSLLDCINKQTGQKVPWSAAFGCWDLDPHPAFPHDDDFVELVADRSWRFECTLENLDDRDEYVRTMEGLEAWQMYAARIYGPALGAFRMWQYGTKEDLLRGTVEEKTRRWEVDGEEVGGLEVERIGEDGEFETIA